MIGMLLVAAGAWLGVGITGGIWLLVERVRMRRRHIRRRLRWE